MNMRAPEAERPDMTLTQTQQPQQQIASTQNQRMHMAAPEAERYNMNLTSAQQPQQQQIASTQNQRMHMAAPEVERYNMNLTSAQQPAQRADYTNALSQFGTKVQGGNSKSTGTTNAKANTGAQAAPSFGNYDKSFQYSAAIEKAAKEGDYKKAAILEYLMNEKIKGEKLPYNQQNNYSQYLEGVTQSDINMAKYGADVTPTGHYYKVGPDGHAPKGLNPGDYVVTGGGVYMITGQWDNATNNYTGAVKVDGGTNTGNYNGTYSIPGSTLQQLGLETAPTTYDPLRDAFTPDRITMDDLNADAAQQYDLARQQIENQINYTMETGEENYRRAYEDALPGYASQRAQTELEGNRNAKNSALYAEQRGDRGGIGQAQYNAMQIAKANQLNQINAAQNKLASDTARSIADLRRQGNYELADKMLELSQNYLSQMNENRKWIANYDMSLAQLDRQDRSAELEYLQAMAGLTGTLPNGTPTFAAQQAATDNAYRYLSAFGNNPFGLWGGIQTTDYTQQQWENRQNALADSRSWLTSLYQNGLVPSAQDFEAAGITDPYQQTVMKYIAQLYGARDMMNGGADALAMYPYGYPPYAPIGQMVGGANGAALATGGGSGYSSGSGRRTSSTPTPTPAQTPPAQTPPAASQQQTNPVSVVRDLIKYT